MTGKEEEFACILQFPQNRDRKKLKHSKMNIEVQFGYR
jgi:hypothetical protein